MTNWKASVIFFKSTFYSRSVNHTLAEEAEIEAEEMYFEKLEKKEAMEEKMLNTRLTFILRIKLKFTDKKAPMLRNNSLTFCFFTF